MFPPKPKESVSWSAGGGELDLQEFEWLSCELKGDPDFFLEDLGLECLLDFPLKACSLAEEEEDIWGHEMQSFSSSWGSLHWKGGSL